MSCNKRFAKAKWIRMLNALIDAADAANPGNPDEQFGWYTVPQAQKVRWENRYYDFKEISERAVRCRDAVSTLRK